MPASTGSTRRSFISVAGAALSAPLVAAGATLPGRGEGDTLRARLAKLEDEHAIRALNQLYVQHVNAGAHEDRLALFADPSAARIDEGICGISGEGFGEHDVIDIAADRQTAAARVQWTVHTEAVIGPSCTVVEMARLQGGGVIHSTEPAVFENLYVRGDDGMWRLRASTRIANSSASRSA